VVVAPGQGAQRAGMLTPWLKSAAAKKMLAELSDVAGLDLHQLGTAGSDDQIRATEIAQPLLLAASLLSWQALIDHPETLNVQPDDFELTAVAGHSVGEFAAAVICGSLNASDAMALVAERGRAMAAAAAAGPPTGMSAVLGRTKDDVITQIEALGLAVANINADGQIVAAGETAELKRLSDQPPAGARVRPLAVSGAFHTKYMEPAAEQFTNIANQVEFHNPEVAFISNAGGKKIVNGEALRDHLIAQIANQVDWLGCQDQFEKLGLTRIIELAPSGTLTAIAKRQTPEIEAIALAQVTD
jgi:[acyl-carrier-protein] S-malonyltransferase